MGLVDLMDACSDGDYNTFLEELDSVSSSKLSNIEVLRQLWIKAIDRNRLNTEPISEDILLKLIELGADPCWDTRGSKQEMYGITAVNLGLRRIAPLCDPNYLSRGLLTFVLDLVIEGAYDENTERPVKFNYSDVELFTNKLEDRINYSQSFISSLTLLNQFPCQDGLCVKYRLTINNPKYYTDDQLSKWLYETIQSSELIHLPDTKYYLKFKPIDIQYKADDQKVPVSKRRTNTDTF